VDSHLFAVCSVNDSVFLLWFLSKYGRIMGDSSSMVEDSGIERWALTATGRDVVPQDDDDIEGEEEGWRPGIHAPSSKTFEMKKTAGIIVI
jgi:hypothetical protein